MTGSRITPLVVLLTEGDPTDAELIATGRETSVLRQTALDVGMLDLTGWRLVAEIGEAFVSASDPAIAIARLPSIVVPLAADCFVLVVEVEPLLPAVIEIGCADSTRIADLRERIDALIATSANLDPFISAVTGPPANDNLEIAGLLPILSSFGMHSLTAVPVHVGGRVTGLVVLGSSSEQPDAIYNVAYARSIGDAISVALEQNRRLSEMRTAVAARDRAVTVVSHDLRNPLSIILLCANALLDPVPPPPSGVREMAELIKRSSECMQHIVQDLLDRASLDAGRLTLHCRRINAADLTRAVGSFYEPLARERSIELVVSGDSGLDLEADPDRLVQALSNLLGNAIKFTPAGGRVELAASLDDAASSNLRQQIPVIRFTVHDTGPGISVEDLAHVFDWFWRSRAGRDGAGLGLAIAKGLIEAHGGHLRAESTLGVGSTFWFTLPALTRTRPSHSVE